MKSNQLAYFLLFGVCLYIAQSAMSDPIVVIANGGGIKDDLFEDRYQYYKLTITMRGDLSNISAIQAELEHPYQTSDFNFENLSPSFITDSSFQTTDSTITFELSTNTGLTSNEIQLLAFIPNEHLLCFPGNSHYPWQIKWKSFQAFDPNGNNIETTLKSEPILHSTDYGKPFFVKLINIDENVVSVRVSELNGVYLGDTRGLLLQNLLEDVDADFHEVGFTRGLTHAPYYPFTLTVLLESGKELHFSNNLYDQMNPMVWPYIITLDGTMSFTSHWQYFR